MASVVQLTLPDSSEDGGSERGAGSAETQNRQAATRTKTGGLAPGLRVRKPPTAFARPGIVRKSLVVPDAPVTAHQESLNALRRQAARLKQRQGAAARYGSARPQKSHPDAVHDAPAQDHELGDAEPAAAELPQPTDLNSMQVTPGATTRRGDTKRHPKGSKNGGKRTVMEELKRLLQDERALERQLQHDVFRRFHNQPLVDPASLQRHAEELAAQRQQEKQQMQAQLAETRSAVQDLAELLRQPDRDPDYVARVNTRVQGCESHIQEFKTSRADAYEMLLREEVALGRELELLLAQFERWLHDNRHPGMRKSRTGLHARPGTAPAPDLPPEVGQYETYLHAHGGKQGGWETYDHGVFVRVYKKHRGARGPLVAEVAEQLLGKTRDNVEEHLEWYEELRRLDSVRREAVAQWRAARAAREEEQRQQQRQEDEERYAQEQQAARRAAERLQQHQAQKQRELERWRRQREEQEQEERQAAEAARHKRQQRAAAQRAARQAALQAKVAEHSARKQQAQAEKKQLTDTLERQQRLEAQRQAAKIRERNAAAIAQLEADKKREAAQAEADAAKQQAKLDALRDKASHVWPGFSTTMLRFSPPIFLQPE
ncbi:uncharacterized protein MONBRDRAFT_7227 [Monosiga brevicollis MX1]|uniref:Coiled-coil domain-containing protein 112 n=1 Tax=Monosiga brevicollis TaxID=81824 RepID=A9UWC0_MONBE|nr:uncharacterized protein MONBRDRAFT_7227 [Monosiga brevicollis MX1]EDQ90536.1 predicted protein [Monosiga brevicollis MX1]|eukprot:XP_001744587.1 hypothetical protein [Monosiga brevicollis MX1]